MKRILLALYFVLLHLIIVICLWKSGLIKQSATRLGLISVERPEQPELSPHFKRMLAYHNRSAHIVPDDSWIFIGDSITQGLCVTAVMPNAVNYGIGGDTTFGVMQRLDDYEKAIKRSSAVVLAIGVNDLWRRSNPDIVQNYATILDALPNVRIFVSSILPVDVLNRDDMSGYPKRIVQLNDSLRSLAKARTNVTYIDNDRFLDADGDQRLDTELHIGDGVHLNSAGNARWVRSLQSVINIKTAHKAQNPSTIRSCGFDKVQPDNSAVAVRDCGS